MKSTNAKRSPRGKGWALAPLVALACAFAYQNCSKFSASEAFNGGSIIGSFSNEPATGKIDPKCEKSADYDACLIYKNPVAQRKSPFATAVTNVDVDSIQRYGVKLTGLKPGPGLASDFIEVVSAGEAEIDPAKGFKYRAQNDSARFNQVLTYYWLNRTGEYVLGRTGIYYAAGHSLRAIVDDTMTGWSPKTTTLHLGKTDAGSAAWSAEVGVHLLGLANLHFASGGAINKFNPQTHRDCGVKGAGCCAVPAGCARAIASGVGDYFVGMMFPEEPTVGETWGNSIEGMSACGISRNLNDAARVPAQAAFEACLVKGVPGETATMGTVYASIWWETRKLAMKEMVEAGIEIDTLFMQHLSLLTGDDTFQTAILKAKKIDEEFYSGRYSSALDAQLKLRGL